MSDPILPIEGALASVPRGALVSGRTAGFLYGVTVVEPLPVQLTLPPGATLTSRKRIAIRRSAVPPSDVARLQGFPVTSITRTLLDLSNQLPLVQAVAATDQALHLGLVTLDELTRAARARTGRWGVNRFRRVVGFAEPATESPMETELRMLIVLNGLPRPEAQVELHDARGAWIARVDLFYRSARLGLEFDGSGHRDQMVEDLRRQNLISGADYDLLRFTTPDVRMTPELTILQIASRLRVLCKKPLTRAEWARFLAQKPPRVVAPRLAAAG